MIRVRSTWCQNCLSTMSNRIFTPLLSDLLITRLLVLGYLCDCAVLVYGAALSDAF
jgi:hypothetical protein